MIHKKDKRWLLTCKLVPEHIARGWDDADNAEYDVRVARRVARSLLALAADAFDDGDERVRRGCASDGLDGVVERGQVVDEAADMKN